jgi:hypothetical protein
LALTPYQNEALLREVDDAVRQDDLVSFWRTYGKLLAAAVVLGLAAFGGWLLWQNQQVKAAEARSVELSNLLKAAQGATLDQPVYNRLVADGGPGYRAQAELIKAALAAGRGDDKTATETYQAVIGDAGALAPMKDAALLRKTALGFDSMTPEAVVAALKDLAVPGNPWFGSAGELTAIAYLKMGRRDQAGQLFATISRDPPVPESIKLRAGQMASMLGSLPATAPAAAATPAAALATTAPAPSGAAKP